MRDWCDAFCEVDFVCVLHGTDSTARLLPRGRGKPAGWTGTVVWGEGGGGLAEVKGEERGEGRERKGVSLALEGNTARG